MSEIAVQPSENGSVQRRKLADVPTRNGFMAMPETMGEAWAMCERISKSALVPDHLRGKTEDIFLTISFGASVGLNWTQSIQGVAVIGKRAGLFGDHLLGVVQASPHYERHEEWYELDGVRLPPGAVSNVPRSKFDGLTAFCLAKRKGDPEVGIQSFSWQQAKEANLTTKVGPWKEYPARQLQMRARGFALRDKFADVLKGLGMVEELRDIPEEPKNVSPLTGGGNDRVKALIKRAAPVVETETMTELEDASQPADEPIIATATYDPEPEPEVDDDHPEVDEDSALDDMVAQHVENLNAMKSSPECKEYFISICDRREGLQGEAQLRKVVKDATGQELFLKKHFPAIVRAILATPLAEGAK